MSQEATQGNFEYDDYDGERTEMLAMRPHLDATENRAAGAMPELQTNSMGSAEPMEGKAKGFVYFIETPDSQYVKIGFSRKPTRRLSQLGTIMPVRLIGTFPATFETESWLHRKFAAFHETGEWFRSTPELRLFIETIGVDPPPPPAAPYVKKARRPRNKQGTSLAESGITLAEHLRKIQSAGGKARAEALTEAQRKRIARKGGKAGGKARAEALTPAERSAIASAAVKQRWANKRAADAAATRRRGGE